MSVLRSKYPDMELSDTLSYSDFVISSTEGVKDKIAIIDDVTGEKITYGSLEEKVHLFACALSERGLHKGDVVCQFADKSITGTIAFFGTLQAGGVVTPCRPSHTTQELLRQVNDSCCTIIVADNKLLPTVDQALASCPSVKKVYSIGSADTHESVDDLLGKASSKQKLPSIIPKEDLALIIYSSGTTGMPKGAMLTHYNIIAAARCALYNGAATYSGHVFFQNLPPFHMGGLITMQSYLSTHKQLVLYTPTSALELLRKAKHYNVRTIVILPHLLNELTKLPVEAITSVGLYMSEVVLLTGGAGLNATNTREVIAKTKVKDVVQLYGASEISGVVVADEVGNTRPGSAGLLGPNTQLKVVDMHTGEILGANQEGEIYIKGPMVGKGYLKNPEANKDYGADGWFRMGDIGYYDDTGHIYIVDRAKDIIKYKILAVSPAEIEEVIYRHPAVKTTCVIPVDNEESGEVPLACVILKDGVSETEEIKREIIKLVEENLADYKHLRGGVRFMKEFPLTSIGKIIRRSLRDIVQTEIKSQKE